MKSLLFVVVFLSCALAKPSFPPNNSLQIRRPSLAQRHFRHDSKDFALIATFLSIGSGMQIGDFVVDTMFGDLEVTVCAHNPPRKDEMPCFDAAMSYSFEKRTDHTAADSVVNNQFRVLSNITFATRKPPTPYIGNLGLGWPSISLYPGETSFPMDFLRGSEKRKFSLSIGLDECESSMDFSGNDLCREGATTVHLPVTSKSYWQFSAASFALGSVKHARMSHAVINTKTEYIGVPSRFLSAFTKTYSIPWDSANGAYTVDCGRISGLPDLEIKVHGGSLRVKAAQYVYTKEKLKDGRCVLNLEDSAASGFGAQWYFGLPLLQSYCISFDFDQKRLGFTENDIAYQCKSINDI